MSNRPDDDPIEHAAKFLWIFAAIPLIFGAIPFFLPADFGADVPAWTRAIPFVVAALIALVGLGVRKRVAMAAWAGIALFAAALVGLFASGIGDGKRRGLLFVAILLLWPIRKLLAALAAMRGAAPQP